MEDKSIEQDLIECREQLKSTNIQLETLKLRMERQANEYEDKIKEKQKALNNLLADNVRLYSQESKEYFNFDELQDEIESLKKSNKEYEDRIEKLEKENEKLKEELIKFEERKNFSNDPQWKALKSAGKQKAHS